MCDHCNEMMKEILGLKDRVKRQEIYINELRDVAENYKKRYILMERQVRYGNNAVQSSRLEQRNGDES